MESINKIVQENFNNQLEQWEKSLRAELKVEDLQTKLTKKLAQGTQWPILSLKASNHFLPSAQSWKKSSQTYVNFPSNLKAMLLEDLQNGVRLFFLNGARLSTEAWEIIKKTVSEISDIEIVILGKFDPGHVSFKVVTEAQLMTARHIYEQGGHDVMELAVITKEVIQKAATSSEIYLGVYVGSAFFQNIAKLRAARLLAQKVLNELGLKKTVQLVALTSFREWTLYERYSNLLRNDVSVASALIAGAEYVQSSGYQTLFEIEKVESSSEHDERSRRMARNTSHILALESMLGVVEDAASGSFHLEAMTENLAKESWVLMQKILKEGESFLKLECEVLQKDHQLAFRKRKKILAGINDFPDVKEKLGLKTLPANHFFRLSRDFEELRFRVEKLNKRPKVYIALLGDLAALNARINFVKNYFEVAGLEVIEPHHSQVEVPDLSSHTEEIIVLCAKDEDYIKFKTDSMKTQEKFVAGKVELPGFKNLFAGQDVYETLLGVVNRMEGK